MTRGFWIANAGGKRQNRAVGHSRAQVQLKTIGEHTFVKKTCPVERASKLAFQFEWLKQRQGSERFPRLLTEGREGDSYFYSMDYRPEFVPFSDAVTKLDSLAREKLLERVLAFVDTEIHVSPIVSSSRANLERYLGDKLVGKLKTSSELRPELTAASRATVRVEENRISFVEERSPEYQALFKFVEAKFAQELSAPRKRSILFHEAVHFARLLPYQIEFDPCAAPAFLGLCARLLDDYVRQFE
jgi:hypothetical protein